MEEERKGGLEDARVKSPLKEPNSPLPPPAPVTDLTPPPVSDTCPVQSPLQPKTEPTHPPEAAPAPQPASQEQSLPNHASPAPASSPTPDKALVKEPQPEPSNVKAIEAAETESAPKADGLEKEKEEKDEKEPASDPVAEFKASVAEHRRRSPDYIREDIIDGFAIVSFRNTEELLELEAGEKAAEAAAIALAERQRAEAERKAREEAEKRLPPPPPKPPRRPAAKRPKEIAEGGSGGTSSSPAHPPPGANGMAVKRTLEELGLEQRPLKAPKTEPVSETTSDVSAALPGNRDSRSQPAAAPAFTSPPSSAAAALEKQRMLSGGPGPMGLQPPGSRETGPRPGFSIPFMGLPAGAGINPALLQSGLLHPSLVASLSAAGGPLHSLLHQASGQSGGARAPQAAPPRPSAPPKPTPPPPSASMHLTSPSTSQPASSSSSTNRRSGKWCAMHVKIAWDIYKQEQEKSKGQQKSAPAPAPPASTSKTNHSHHNGGVNGAELSVIASTGPSPSQRKSLDNKSGTPGSRAESRAGESKSVHREAPSSSSAGAAAALLNGAASVPGPSRAQPPPPAFSYASAASLAHLTSMASGAGFPPSARPGFPPLPVLDLGLPPHAGLASALPTGLPHGLPFPGLFPPASLAQLSSQHFPLSVSSSASAAFPPAPAVNGAASHSSHGHQLQLAPEFQSLSQPKSTASSSTDYLSQAAALASASGVYGASLSGSSSSGFPVPTSLFNPGLPSSIAGGASGSGMPSTFPSNPLEAAGLDPYASYLAAARQRQLDMISMSQRDEVFRRQQAALLGAAGRPPSGASAGYPSLQGTGASSSLQGAGALSGLLEQELLARQRLLHSGFPPPPPLSGLPPGLPGLPSGLDPSTLFSGHRPPFPHPGSAGYPTGVPNGKLPGAPGLSFSSSLEQLARHKASLPPSSGTFPLLPPHSSANLPPRS